MGWFERTYPWIPATDAAGHELGPGKISLSFDPCRTGCPAITDGRGHNIAFCRISGCTAPAARPADCVQNGQSTARG
jgi:hypothetical protein